MQNNIITDEEILKELASRHSVAENKYYNLLMQAESARQALNKCIMAINAFSDKELPLIGEDGDISAATVDQAKTSLDKNGSEIEYDKDAIIRDKIITVLKIHNRGITKQELAEYISKKEKNKDIEEIKSGLSSELNYLSSTGVLIKSKLDGVKMKGFFYGHPSWLISDGVWVKQHAPVMKTTEQPSLW